MKMYRRKFSDSAVKIVTNRLTSQRIKAKTCLQRQSDSDYVSNEVARRHSVHGESMEKDSRKGQIPGAYDDRLKR